MKAREELSPEKIEQMNRAEKRGYQRDGKSRERRTGTTQHFARWRAEGRAKSTLQRLKLSQLAESIEDGELSATFGLLFVGGVKSAWDLSQAPLGDLLQISGIDPVRLGSVEDYLTGKKVPLQWTAKSGD